MAPEHPETVPVFPEFTTARDPDAPYPMLHAVAGDVVAPFAVKVATGLGEFAPPITYTAPVGVATAIHFSVSTSPLGPVTLNDNVVDPPRMMWDGVATPPRRANAEGTMSSNAAAPSADTFATVDRFIAIRVP